MAISRISFQEAKEILDGNPGAVLLDVRTEDEYTAEHALGAVLLTLDEINEETAREVLPEKSAPVLVYCRTGRRSREAAELLEDLGYTALYDLGGLNGWPYGMDFGL